MISFFALVVDKGPNMQLVSCLKLIDHKPLRMFSQTKRKEAVLIISAFIKKFLHKYIAQVSRARTSMIINSAI